METLIMLRSSSKIPVPIRRLSLNTLTKVVETPNAVLLFNQTLMTQVDLFLSDYFYFSPFNDYCSSDTVTVLSTRCPWL